MALNFGLQQELDKEISKVPLTTGFSKPLLLIDQNAFMDSGLLSPMRDSHLI
ncbi:MULTISPECIES: hypothetical protein [Acidithrix]|uniref:Uncharacterized protein n=1 Tax=Acidithrix ferrooxidans TaxID=1280514 RepID=A0A0D8HIY5_9ACTN|nr:MULTISPECIES: hypothetical protein [Acidithrix]KJF17056.1 hypothetical protein AXFE_20520 [Acidithrix ferrooxidans]